jgi:hypothetical protein
MSRRVERRLSSREAVAVRRLRPPVSRRRGPAGPGVAGPSRSSGRRSPHGQARPADRLSPGDVGVTRGDDPAGIRGVGAQAPRLVLSGRSSPIVAQTQGTPCRARRVGVLCAWPATVRSTRSAMLMAGTSRRWRRPARASASARTSSWCIPGWMPRGPFARSASPRGCLRCRCSAASGELLDVTAPGRRGQTAERFCPAGHPMAARHHVRRRRDRAGPRVTDAHRRGRDVAVGADRSADARVA